MTHRLAGRIECSDLAAAIAVDDETVNLVRGLPTGAVRLMSPDPLHRWFG